MNSLKIFNDNKKIIGLITVVLVVISSVWIFREYYTPKMVQPTKEKMENVEETEESASSTPEPIKAMTSDSLPTAPVPDFSSKSDTLCPKELLPKNMEADAFSKEFPSGVAELTSKNFLTAGHNIGINTVSGSLRNPNLQIRSDPFIPPQQVGPWGQSTVVPDMNRKSFEIGA